MKKILLLIAGLLVAAAVVAWIALMQEHSVAPTTVDSLAYKTPQYAFNVSKQMLSPAKRLITVCLYPNVKTSLKDVGPNLKSY